MTKVLMLSIDARIFEEGSSVCELMKEYGTVVEELHIIVHTKPGYAPTKLSENVWAHPTNTYFRPAYFTKAINLGSALIKKMGGTPLITSQESLTNIVGIILKRRFGCALQAQVHVDFGNPAYRKESWGNRLRYHLYRYTLARADCIRVVSEKIKQSITSFGITAPVTVLPVFVDIAAIEAMAPVPLHEKYPQFNFIVAMLGRLAPEKDFKTAIMAIKKLRVHDPRAGLVILGEGPQRHALVQYAGLLDVEDGVIFAGHQHDAIAQMKSADAVMVTSRYEGYGRMLVEAAAARRPIVSTDVGVVGDLLVKGESVTVCPVGDSECFAEALFGLVRDNHQRLTMGSAARDSVFEKSQVSKGAYLSFMGDSFNSCRV